MTKRGQYSQQTKLAVLAALDRNGGNIYKTVKECGISKDTVRRWVKESKRDELRDQPNSINPDDEAALDDQLEQLVRQMVAVMPEKVEEANLQEIARSLVIVLGTMNQARTDKEKSSHAREKLAEILERYAVNGSEEGTSEAADGE